MLLFADGIQSFMLTVIRTQAYRTETGWYFTRYLLSHYHPNYDQLQAVDVERKSYWNYRASLRGCDSLISVAMGKLTVPVH